MPAPRAYIGERWYIAGLGWRRIVAIRKDRHGRLYGVRSTARFYPLYDSCSVEANWGRYVRSRALIKPDRATKMKRRQLSTNKPRRARALRLYVDRRGAYVVTYGSLRLPFAHLIAQGLLGRRLEPSEVVHHKNGKPLDNRPENLQPMTRSEHTRLHSNARWREARLKSNPQAEGRDK